MKKISLIILMLVCVFQVYGLETAYKNKAEGSHWYDLMSSFSGQSVPSKEGKDLIVVNHNRSISFNGHTLKLRSSINTWVDIMGKADRIDESEDIYYWDDKGILLKVRNGEVRAITIQFLTYSEIVHGANTLGENSGSGGLLSGCFKGIVQLDDGYLARNIVQEEFEKSDMWDKFSKSAYPNTYHASYVINMKYQVNNLSFTKDGRTKHLRIH